MNTTQVIQWIAVAAFASSALVGIVMGITLARYKKYIKGAIEHKPGTKDVSPVVEGRVMAHSR